MRRAPTATPALPASSRLCCHGLRSVNGNVPIAEIPIINGTGTAVWEVVNTNPNTIESFKFAVYVTYAANVAQNSPPPGNATVNLSLAATANSGVAADAGSPMPRFAADANPRCLCSPSRPAPPPPASASPRPTPATSPKGRATPSTRWWSRTRPGQARPAGTVTVTETVPTGLTLVSMAGHGMDVPARRYHVYAERRAERGLELSRRSR